MTVHRPCPSAHPLMQIAQMFGATVGDPDAYAAVQSCATSSSRVDGVRRLNPRTGADDPANVFLTWA